MRCAQGHDSQADDYCSVCGIPMQSAESESAQISDSGSQASATAHVPSGRQICPLCQSAAPASSFFCETCGYDFLTGALPRDAGGQLSADRTGLESQQSGGDVPGESDSANIASGNPVGNDPDSQASASVIPAPANPLGAVDIVKEQVSSPLTVAADSVASEEGSLPSPDLHSGHVLEVQNQSSPDRVAGQQDSGHENSAVPSPEDPSLSRQISFSAGQDAQTCQIPIVGPAGEARWVAEIWIDPEWYRLQQAPEPLPSPGQPMIRGLRKSLVIIGRTSGVIHPDLDCFTDTGVSRQQAALTTDGTRWFVEDLGSSNGTYVGMVDQALPIEPISQRIELGPHHRIYIGSWTRVVVRHALVQESDL